MRIDCTEKPPSLALMVRNITSIGILPAVPRSMSNANVQSAIQEFGSAPTAMIVLRLRGNIPKNLVSGSSTAVPAFCKLSRTKLTCGWSLLSGAPTRMLTLGNLKRCGDPWSSNGNFDFRVFQPDAVSRCRPDGGDGV